MTFAVIDPNDNELAALPLRISFPTWEKYQSRATNKALTGIMPPGIYHGFNVVPAGGLNVIIEADGGTALVLTEAGESINVQGQHPITQSLTPGTHCVLLTVNFTVNVLTTQVSVDSLISPADIVISASPTAPNSLLLAVITIGAGTTVIDSDMIDTRAVSRRSIADLQSLVHQTVLSTMALQTQMITLSQAVMELKLAQNG
jgi:hypothetical protein